MAIDPRTLTMLAQWAKNAQTSIPSPPVPDIAYRDINLSTGDVETGQKYSSLLDSSDWNQLFYLVTGLLVLAERYGILPWSELTDYKTGSMTLGPDGVLYQALQDSGPASAFRRPPEAAYWKTVVAGDATEAQKGLIEIATQAEVNTGTDATRAVVPAHRATHANYGLARFATAEEISAGTNNAVAVTPAQVIGAIPSFPLSTQNGGTGNQTGNAATATTLATTRELSSNDNATGSVNFNGSANAAIPIAVTVAAGTAANTLPGTGTLSLRAWLTVARNCLAWLTARFNASGQALTAVQLATARTVAISGKVTGTATSFNGTANISIPVTAVTADSCTGNSATATTLATARTIAISGAVTGTATSFNGSANITIPITALNVGSATAGTLAAARGGTGLTASPSLLINLASTSAANVLAASPRPGVTGVLPIANGGTGSNSAAIATTAYRSGASWYIKFSTGLIMQGGSIAANAGTTGITVNLVTNFSNTNYQIVVGKVKDNSGNTQQSVIVRSKTATSFVANKIDAETIMDWMAIGY